MKRLVFLLAIAALWSCQKPAPTEPMAAAPAAPKAVEIGDSTLIPIVQQSLDGLSSGNIDSFAQNLTDSCVYSWNAGDSLAGKAAIINYWKARRGDVIETLTYSKQIFLPVHVNESKYAPHGNTVLAWMQVNAKYKTGKSMQQWMHLGYHFTDDRKIDYVFQYIDRVPIEAATKK